MVLHKKPNMPIPNATHRFVVQADPWSLACSFVVSCMLVRGQGFVPNRRYSKRHHARMPKTGACQPLVPCRVPAEVSDDGRTGRVNEGNNLPRNRTTEIGLRDNESEKAGDGTEVMRVPESNATAYH